MQNLDLIKEFLKPILIANDVYLDDMVYEKEADDYFLRIFIEKNEGMLDMETCVTVSELISAMLDEKDPIKGEYILEVSSPGAEKQLKTFEQVVKSVGEYVYIQLINPMDGLDEVEGTIEDVENEDIQVSYLVKNIKKKVIINYKNIKFIRLAVKF